MSDEDVREAERRWRASGSVEDEAAWLRARLRAGTLPLAHVHAAAFLGHAAARLVEAAPWPEDMIAARSASVSEIAARLWEVCQRVTLDPRVAREWLCRCAEHALPLFERTLPDDSRPRDAIAMARRFLLGEVDVGALTVAEAASQSAGVEAVMLREDHAASGAAFEAASSCAVDLQEALPPSFAQDAVRDAGGDVEAEARWQADALIALLLA